MYKHTERFKYFSLDPPSGLAYGGHGLRGLNCLTAGEERNDTEQPLKEYGIMRPGNEEATTDTVGCILVDKGLSYLAGMPKTTTPRHQPVLANA